MATKSKQIQFIIDEWQNRTGKTEIDMREVVQYAIRVHNWPLPEPISAEERLQKEFSQAAREATLPDGKTGQEYRVYHAVPNDGKSQGVFWVNIDKAERKHMVKSVRARRDQVVGDMVQLTLDLNHWNRVNPNEAPIELQTDITPDINEFLALSSGTAEGEEAV